MSNSDYERWRDEAIESAEAPAAPAATGSWSTQQLLKVAEEVAMEAANDANSSGPGSLVETSNDEIGDNGMTHATVADNDSDDTAHGLGTDSDDGSNRSFRTWSDANSWNSGGTLTPIDGATVMELQAEAVASMSDLAECIAWIHGLRNTLAPVVNRWPILTVRAMEILDGAEQAHFATGFSLSLIHI